MFLSRNPRKGWGHRSSGSRSPYQRQSYVRSKGHNKLIYALIAAALVCVVGVSALFVENKSHAATGTATVVATWPVGFGNYQIRIDSAEYHEDVKPGEEYIAWCCSPSKADPKVGAKYNTYWWLPWADPSHIAGADGEAICWLLAHMGVNNKKLGLSVRIR